MTNNVIESIYGLKVLANTDLNAFIDLCRWVYKGEPYWTTDSIVTVNFAQTVASEISRLATMNIAVDVTGSARADWLNEVMTEAKDEWRNWTEYGVAYGTIVLKPHENGIDVVTPDRFKVLGAYNGHITDIVFEYSSYDTERDCWWTRLERHTLGEKYTISNRAFRGDEEGDLEKEVDLAITPWNGIAEEVTAEGVEHMLFGVFRMPGANSIDESSPLGLPCFANAMQELKDLDTAYSLNAYEIAQSRKVVMLDADRLTPGGAMLGGASMDSLVEAKGLPAYVKLVYGDGVTDVYKEIVPTLNTEVRQNGINSLLSQIGFKCGFSNGYFVFNERSGIMTATQVESDDRRTLQLVNDVRSQLRACIEDLVYAIDRMADAYGWASKGDYEITFDFEDLTLNKEEDKARWLSYVQSGLLPFWRYLVKWEGMSEEEAKEIATETSNSPALFE